MKVETLNANSLTVKQKKTILLIVLLTYLYLNLDPDRVYNGFTTKHIPPI